MKKGEVTELAGLILKNLKARVLIQPKVPEGEISSKIESVILKNLQGEEAIEEEVKRIMEQYKSQIASGSVDPQKIYIMIKKQVAKDRKFIL